MNLTGIPEVSKDPSAPFPAPSAAGDRHGGLIAWGGCLSTQRLVNAYRHGIFPWFSEGDPILWWNPMVRAVLFPDQIYCNRSLRKFIKKCDYRISLNQNFNEVIEQCAHAPRGPNNGTWITQEMCDAYKELHQHGSAHSVEVWHHDQLIGGLYGIQVGSVFAGESMFSIKPNASKIALLALAQDLIGHGLRLIDCQIMNDHLENLGAILVHRDDYLDYLQQDSVQIPAHIWQSRELNFLDVGNPC
ncbi:leucyl/phenylalanyl-tRNA--protein transferase [Aliidiomarina halalkaliphila]|uniref:Leucyl/phenylalanyl-tRNA--protein transferase n=1 Tax=Aliidiomarina halalkaliphila TaxID=2593535 RepID=A0A552X678_9GAMM|nr:leucyl/phenylalanyl-tRNA--protein transferase [Aliidiomarina halalkaliphila]